ncbi:hypothetical protein TIFTF001_005188 [Ficus carica]|uniref:Isoamylase 1-3-like C-terminal domain-containing protein n=1 Tax=Ficus carica TaxID=3494 RepID=A0AA87ZL21_FICCA|nr:hypothetical protein TIFTF001_005188 [Ficus carica]
MVEEIGGDTASRAGATILGAAIDSGSGGVLIAIGNPREIREAPKQSEFATAEIVRSSADTLKIGVEIATQTETKWFGSKTQEIGVENVAQINGRRDFWTVVEQVPKVESDLTGNTLNCNHPVVMGLILDSLRHWVVEYHVDGFRFDLASVLCRGTDGAPLNAPPLVKSIAKDAILSRCKIIAEPWDCGGLYLVGSFPNWDRWAEWNGKFRDDMRRFIKGDCGMKGSFATRVAGSADLYKANKRTPYHSVNFVIAHDGFTLYDLVSYNLKHNDANGEGGNDGNNDNFSWNCGCEGETDNNSIKALRSRQIKNFHLALVVSQLEARRSNHFRFFKEAIKFRRTRRVFSRDTFLGKNDVTWHEDNWDNHESKFLAFTLHDSSGEDIYLAFNAHDFFVKVSIPPPPAKRRWFRVVDTNMESPDDFVTEGVPGIGSTYNVAPYSSILLEAKI